MIKSDVTILFRVKELTTGRIKNRTRWFFWGTELGEK